jgi:excisionase family DNA binding protein
MNVKEAAKQAGVSPAMVYQWCAERRLPHLRLGGRGRRGKISIAPEDLAAFLRTCRVDNEDAEALVEPSEPETVPAPKRNGPGIDLW